MSHHHHHHHHHQQSRSPPCCCSNTCFCCSYSNSNCCCCCSNSTPNPISSTPDLLLQTLLLIQSQPQPQPPPPPRPIFLKPHPNKNPRHPLRSQPKHKQHDHDDVDVDVDVDVDDDDDAGPSLHLLHSLIRRVAALESSLSKISPPPPQKQQPQPQPQQRGQSSLKHAAAATIQRCFRRLLARRSRTLRHLNHLASIKSQAAALTSSLSVNTHLITNNPKALSRRAMLLLSHLHSIQSSDPMIREGKRSVSKELVRISEFVQKVLLIRENENGVEELERSIDRARRVSFAATEENGDGNVFDHLLQRNPEAEDEEEEEVQGANESLKVVRHNKFTNGGLGLAAPLPVQMEPRRTASLKKVAIEEY